MNSNPGESEKMYSFPKAHLHHYNGGHIKRGTMYPKIRKEGRPDQFRLVPVDENGNLAPLQEPIITQSEYVAFLRRASALQHDIAIQHEDDNGKNSYISCRTMCFITGGAFAEYRSSVEEYEKFRVEHCHETGTFSFRSHNGLYLHYNALFVAFKPEPASVAKWMVHPLGLIASDEESVIYVGVVKLVDNGNDDAGAIMERTAAGVLLDSQDHARVIDLLRQELSGGGSSLFAHPDTGHQWLVTVDKDTTAYIVITSPNYPQYLAVECIVDLAALHDKYRDGGLNALLERHGLNETDVQGKEMMALMDYYDGEYASSTVREVSNEVETLKKKMSENIAKIQENIESEEKLLETAKELEEMAKQFKKLTGRLSGKTHKKIAAVMTLSGALVGGGVGFAMGGPGGALVLGTEAAEIFVGIGAGLCGGLLSSKVCLKFWERGFVSLGRTLVRLADGSFGSN